MANTRSTITRPMDAHGHGPWCEFCHDEVVRGSQIHQWFDAHGDGHWLCPSCYEEAISPAVEVRPGKVLGFSAVLLVVALLAILFTSGCSSFEPLVQVVDVGGQMVVEHIDTDDAPASCGDRITWAGCHARINGASHIWRASRVAEHTIEHERAHAAGMMRTPWQVDFLGRPWCTVVVAGGKYRVGDRIYVDQRGEFVLSGASHAAS